MPLSVSDGCRIGAQESNKKRNRRQHESGLRLLIILETYRSPITHKVSMLWDCSIPVFAQMRKAGERPLFTPAGSIFFLQQRRGIFVEEGPAIRMFLQFGGGDHVGHGTFQSLLDRFGFAQIGHGVDDAAGFHALFDAH